MKPSDLVRESWERLASAPLRTGLTMFGVAWGCASVLILSGFATSAQTHQQEIVSNYGRNLVVIRGGVAEALGSRLGRAVLLDRRDARSVREAAGAIAGVTAEFVRVGVSVASDFQSARLRVHGVESDYSSLRYMPLAEGRFIDGRDLAEGARVAVLGAEIRRRLFAERPALGRQIRIAGMPYRVVGLLSEKEEYSGLEGPDSEMIAIPASTFERQIPVPPPAPPSTVHHLLIAPRTAELSTTAEREAVAILGRIHGFDPSDVGAVSVWDTAYEAGLFTEMFSAIGRFFGVVGLTTLALGILGVMNVTLVTVSERVREIGVRRALGAKRRVIVATCLVESLLLTVSSGGAGAAFALLTTTLLRLAPLPETLGQPTIPLGTLALVLSSLVAGGAASGLYPAFRATSVDIVAALREE
jgi:putative ABC transport system permease protein